LPCIKKVVYIIDMNQELILKQAIKDNRATLSNPDSIYKSMLEFQQLLMLYDAGIKQITTKFDILKEEFNTKNLRNPIEAIHSRIKDPMSIIEKLTRKGLSISYKNIVSNLTDVAGVRVVCPFISDVYHVAKMISEQDDVSVITVKDYIKNPKQNGYRSLHLIVNVDVYLSEQKHIIPVEIQVRTIAMDFWASLEHQLHYKKDFKMPENVDSELKSCADIIAQTDKRMQELAKNLPNFKDYSQDLGE